MSKKYNMFYVLGLAYIAYITGGVAMEVGKVSDCSTDPYGWDLPLKAIIILGTPLILGYLAGKATEASE